MDIGGNNFLQVGRVLIRDERNLAVLHRLSQSNGDSHWLTLSENLPGKMIKVTTTWAPFFASMLVSPSNYNWAKSFIASEAWVFFSNSLNTSLIKIPDYGPAKKPICIGDAASEALPDCTQLVTKKPIYIGDVTSEALPECTQLITQDSATPTKKGKKSARNNVTPTVESEVRSPRLKESNKGFKLGSCHDKRCLACNSSPPDLPIPLIKKLGVDLCKVDENLLSEEALNQRWKRNRKEENKDAGATGDKKEMPRKIKKGKQAKENNNPNVQASSKDSQKKEDANLGGEASKKTKKT